jgi:outer membrane protein
MNVARSSLIATFVLATSLTLSVFAQGGQSGIGSTGQSGAGTRGRTQMPAPVVLAPLSGSAGTGSPTQVPGAARVTTGPSALGLEQAIELAIQNNLATLLARERQQEARGLTQQSRAALLPNISGTSYQANITENLAALGFQPGTFPGIERSFIGPFKNFDARASLFQSIFNLSSIRNYQAAREGIRVAQLEEELAKEQVAAGAALAYLEGLRSDRAVAAAYANVELAQALATLAVDQRNAGVATGVDVTRAQTRLAEEQVRLAQAQTNAEQARLNLQRILGLPLGAELRLTDLLRFTNDPLPAPETAVAQAAQERREIRIAETQVRASDLERKAARAERLPSLAFVGDYGISGITPTNNALPTRRVAIQLDVPIFNGGLTEGRITAATSRERQAELQLGSVRIQVEEDVRLALATLRTAAAQVSAADQSFNLATRELEMSRDRFSAGVADNLEVINAQTSLANARDAQIAALAQYNAARLNLAAALGRTQSFRW